MKKQNQEGKFFSDGNEQNYDSDLKPVGTFNTIEDFWAIYQQLHHPTKMTSGTLIHLFVEGVKPMWEDSKCEAGGMWSLK